MQHRTGVWQVHERNSHVTTTWLNQITLLLKRSRRVARSSNEVVNRNVRQREIYRMLMGRPCGRRELHRQLSILLRLFIVLVLMLSLMDK